MTLLETMNSQLCMAHSVSKKLLQRRRRRVEEEEFDRGLGAET
ncbi:unnamed protein product [Brassica rapa subsp. narinosa]